MDQPIRIINSVAPIRVCDNGGWTDTWFAGHGRVFSIAVYPYAEVQMRVLPRKDRPRVHIHAENFGDRYSVPDQQKGWEKHPLLEAAVKWMGVPETLAVEINVFSQAPAGASTGTSAAVSVAMIGALDRLVGTGLTAHEVALTAQKIETEMLGHQCGIQDQLASAYGGINYIEMVKYPHAAVSPLNVPNALWWEIERRLSLVYLGKMHSSSRVHEMVIRELEGSGPDSPKLARLRECATLAKLAVVRGDLVALGDAFVQNTEAQRRLHPHLISPEAQSIMDVARKCGALGWKVNGAGGDGGSVAILGGDDSAANRQMFHEIEAINPLFRIIPTYLSRQGLRVWDQPITSPS